MRPGAPLPSVDCPNSDLRIVDEERDELACSFAWGHAPQIR